MWPLIAVALFLAACSTDPSETGRLTLVLTDAPAPELDSARIYVSRSYVIGAGGEVTITDTAAVYELLDLQNGVTALLGSQDLTAGDYSQLRLVVDSARAVLTPPLTFSDGSSGADLKTPSGGTSGIKVNFSGPIQVVPGETVLVVDFDVARSFVLQGPATNPNGISFKPVIHAVAMDVAGSISGTVTPNTSRAMLYAIGSGGDTVASALADSLTGAYTLWFLPPDTYDVDAEAAGFQAASIGGVVVGPAQAVTGVDFTLSP
jgi:hypothetical protein